MSVENMIPVVPGAAWFSCSAALVVRFYLAGAAWNWLLPGTFPAGSGRPARCLVHAAAALALGVSCSLLFSLLLAETGVQSAGEEWLGAALMLLAGLLAGGIWGKSRLKDSITDSLPGALVVFLGFAVILNLPRCGEWIAGGWDPGIYINQGVAVARTGTFHPAAEPHHAALADKELRLFTKGTKGVRPQVFPAVPIDPETRAIHHYFFRLTPTLVSTLARHGGLCAATRVNILMGFLVLVMFAGFLQANRCSPACVWLGTLLLAAHPLWLYHLHFPTSEMTELFLVLGLGMLMPAQRSGWFCRILFLLLLLAAVINRISFLPFGAMILLATSWADMDRGDRRRVIAERLLQLLVLGLGAAYSGAAAAVTIESLGAIVPKLAMVALGCLLLLAAMEWVAFRGMTPRLLQPAVLFGLAATLLVVAGLGAALLSRQVPLLAAIRGNALHIAPYLGLGWILPAIPGLLILWFLRAGQSRHMAALFLVFTGISLLLIVKVFAFPLYPWATRRFLPFTVPLLAAGAAIALSQLGNWQTLSKPVRRLGVAILLAAILASSARLGWHALSGTEYDGLSAQLAALDRNFKPRDVIVADHFKWGTPLTFLHGRQVLDGSSFLASKGAATMTDGLEALSRLKAAGWRILWLTSTAEGLDVYPQPVPGTKLLWSAEPFSFREIIHGPRVVDFVRREKTAIFRLYEWP